MVTKWKAQGRGVHGSIGVVIGQLCHRTNGVNYPFNKSNHDRWRSVLWHNHKSQKQKNQTKIPQILPTTTNKPTNQTHKSQIKTIDPKNKTHKSQIKPINPKNQTHRLNN